MELKMQEFDVEEVNAIVATVDDDLEARLVAMEDTVAKLSASGESLRLLLDELKGSISASATSGEMYGGRKTRSLQATSLQAKEGKAGERIEAESLDAALASLSPEQRIAVKSEMMRSGLLR